MCQHRLANFLLGYWLTPHEKNNRTTGSLFLHRELHNVYNLMKPQCEVQVTNSPS